MRHVAIGLLLGLVTPLARLDARAKSGAVTIGATHSIYSATLKENRKFLVYSDILLAKKDTTKALGYYEKALAMRPGLQRAKDMVQKLKRGP